MAEEALSNLAAMQRRILVTLKDLGESTTAEVADRLGVTYEAIRLQVKQLEAAGWVVRDERPNPSGTGRPVGHYSLSTGGDHLFPKNYDALAMELVDAIRGALGEEALRQVLAAMTEAQVSQWKPELAGLGLEARVEALRGFYVEDDPFTEVTMDGPNPQLVERNCPYLTVALERPAICSLTVSTLSRLLGYQVSRIDRFQNGDGHCTFHIDRGAPIADDRFRFEFEGEAEPGEEA